MVKLKFIFLIIMFLGLKPILLSQEIPLFGHPEEFPRFDSTKNELYNLLLFVAQNVKYPETAIRDFIEGKVFISYWIEEDGTTTNHIVLRGVREDIDQEALRVAKMIKYDIPAKNQSKPVRFQFITPITFSLEDIENKKTIASMEKVIAERIAKEEKILARQERRLARQEKRLTRRNR